MRKPLSFAVIAALVLSLAIAASSLAGSSAPKASGPTIALISDIGKFNDRGFNQNQLAGLNKAKTNLGITALAKQSNSVSDYIPNMTAAVRAKANLVIAAGFLLADATATMAKKFPDTHFAITDYPVEAAPFADKAGKPLYTNVEGLTYAANEGGCLVGVQLDHQSATAFEGDPHHDAATLLGDLERAVARPRLHGRHVHTSSHVIRAQDAPNFVHYSLSPKVA